MSCAVVSWTVILMIDFIIEFVRQVIAAFLAFWALDRLGYVDLRNGGDTNE